MECLVEETFNINGRRYEDRRGKTYRVVTLARDVQTGEQMVVYSQEWGDCETLCCPYDAFKVSMKPVIQEENTIAFPMERKRPGNGQERMMAFLDTDDFTEKSGLLKELYARGEVTNSIIDNLAAALDVVIEEGDLQSRYEQLRICVDTRARYENLRLR